MAMTIAAQLFTLPIQVLIEPELPVYSIPANLVVAPFVGFSTLTGLPASPFHGYCPIWDSYSPASPPGAPPLWNSWPSTSGQETAPPFHGPEAPGGALLIIIVEIVGYMAARLVGTLFTRITTPEPNLPGRRLMRNPVERAKAWGERTHNALKTMKWNE